MNDPDHKTRWAGYRSLHFQEDLHEMYRWDLAYNVDNLLRASDRPYVPRLIPVLRLDKNGHPACHTVSGRKESRILAAVYVESIREIITAVYDPNYEDPAYRYRLQAYKCNQTGVNVGIDNDNARSNLEDLLNAFATWCEAPAGVTKLVTPMQFMSPKRHRAKTAADLPSAYIEQGYGNWA